MPDRTAKPSWVSLPWSSWSSRRSTRRRLLSLVAAAGTGLGLRRGGPTVASVAAAQDAQGLTDETSSYFAETGHNVGEPFLSSWQAAGGKATLGLPLSEQRYATGAGGVLQTFEGMTLVYDPSQEAPADVRGQPFDKTIRRDLVPTSALARVEGCAAADGNCTFFAETGHTVSGRLAEFWTTWGGQLLFGRPLSEPFRDPDAASALAVQLFENAILEDHGQDGVRLRPMGRILMQQNGLTNDPAFKPAPPTGGTTYLVSPDDGLRLRGAPSPDAPVVALLPQNAEFIAGSSADGAWVPGYADGSSGWVAAGFLVERPPLPPLDLSDWNPTVWQGAALGDTNLRAQPTTKSKVVKELAYGDPVTVVAWVQGEEVYTGADLWAELADGTYVYGRNVGRNAPVLPLPPPPDAPAGGKWIDVDLIQQLMTAYEDRDPVRTVEVTTGMAGYETPSGSYQILRRVPNETMTSGAIGAESFFRLEDVLFTQYFTDRGHAIHFAWWRTKETIGRPGSHGCINLLLDDARFFWDWAEIGTPVIIHP